MILLQVTGKEAEYKSILINCWLLCQKKSRFSISKNLKLFVFDCRNRKIPLELKVKTGNFQKREKTRVSKSRLVLVSHLIGLGNGARFLDQSQSEIKQSQSNTELLLTRKWKWLYQVQNFSFLVSVIVGATEQPVNTADEVMSCLDSGSAGRQVGTTNMNERSSRSHTIFTLYVGKRKV